MHEAMIERYMNNRLHLQQLPLVGAILEIYPSKNTVSGGHALFLLKNERTYYVFDDNTTIDLLERYINNRNNNITKLCIYTNDKAAIQEIQQLWGKNAMTARVNNRWEITEDVEDVVVPLYRFLHVGNMSNDNRISGGDATSDNYCNATSDNYCNATSNNYRISGGDASETATVDIATKLKKTKTALMISIIASVILLIILIIEAVMVLSKRKEKYECPCKRKSDSTDETFRRV